MALPDEQVQEVTTFLEQQQSAELRGMVAEQRNQIDYYLRQIQGCEDSIAVYLSTVRDHQTRLDNALVAMNDSSYAERFVEAFGRLANHGRLASARVDGGHLVLITTRDLRLVRDDTGESRWLGAFEIRLNLAERRVFMTNLDTPRGGRDHPHVQNGRPCFGGHGTSFIELLVNGQIDVLYELLIQYIETLNMADTYGSYGSYWFDVPDRELVAA